MYPTGDQTRSLDSAQTGYEHFGLLDSILTNEPPGQGMFIILIAVMGSHVYTYVKAYQIAHFKYVKFTGCHLNLS